MSARPPHIAIAQVGRAHGLRGEVRLTPYGSLESLRPGDTAVVVSRDGRERRVVVEGMRRHREAWLVKFLGIDGAEAAGTLTGARLEVLRSEAVGLPPDMYYHYDILGLRVVTADGEDLGEVVDIWPGPANDVYVVRGPRGEWLLPAAKAVVAGVDLEHGRLCVRRLAGLVDPDPK